jgi:peptidoglycan/LPS O-acetylase OafA/YrhL
MANVRGLRASTTSTPARTPERAERRTPENRLRSLDGLRGVAAAVVVVHHALLLVPTLSDAYLAPGGLPADAPWFAALAVYSPLHLLWAGGEAVLLFFVLSGLVLTMPAVRPGFSWVAYYPRRVVRLYLPVVAAVALTALTLMVVPRTQTGQFGGWVNGHVESYGLGSLARDVTLVSGTSGVITPLWSLQWEVLFSIFLPVFVAVALLLRRRLWMSAVVAGAAVIAGDVLDRPALFYLGAFAVGTALTLAWPRLQDAVAALRGRGRAAIAWVGFGVAAVYLTVGRWIVLDPDSATSELASPGALTVLGAAMLVIAGGLCPPVQRVLETRVAQWLGRISFSLYLLHETVLLTIRHLGPGLPVAVVIAVGLPLSLLLAGRFARWVEVPSHALARRVGDLAVTLQQVALARGERQRRG